MFPLTEYQEPKLPSPNSEQKAWKFLFSMELGPLGRQKTTK